VPAVLAVALLALVPAACGDDDASAPTDPGPTTVVAAPGQPAIVIQSSGFRTIEAPAGTITVENKDGFDHTVTADNGSFSVVVPANGTATFEVTQPGAYEIHCNFHSTMKATLVVV
jgi:plastocyanin